MELLKVRFLQVSGMLVGALTATAVALGDDLPSYIYPVFFGVFGLVYTKWIWKLITPDLNLSGTWWGYTEYKTLERKSQKEQPVLPNKKPHLVKFKQSPFDLCVESSEGKDMVFWKSDAVKLHENGRIVMAYSVSRKTSDKGFPEETKGYEELEVLERNWIGFPIKLKGKFFHAAEPGKNLFSGETEYFKSKPTDSFLKKLEK
jgi:hypothetical protein